MHCSNNRVYLAVRYGILFAYAVAPAVGSLVFASWLNRHFPADLQPRSIVLETFMSLCVVFCLPMFGYFFIHCLIFFFNRVKPVNGASCGPGESPLKVAYLGCVALPGLVAVMALLDILGRAWL